MDRTTRVFSCSYSTKRAQGPSEASDWKNDWSGYNWPFPVVVMAAGNADDEVPGLYIANRFYNGIVVGGSTDNGVNGDPSYGRTNTITDDVVWQDGRYINYQTAHQCSGRYDYELPHIAAPACTVDSACLGPVGGCGTSASTPQVAGTAALVIARDPTTFNYKPEMTKAVLLATATYRLGEGPLTRLSCGMPDKHGGAGALDAGAAVGLADPWWWNRTGSQQGRYFSSVSFASDFQYGYWTRTFNTGALYTTRLRAVITWDATPAGCDSYGNNCTGSTLDADLDLHVIDNSTGVKTQSLTFDSGWEMVDIPVVSGHSYTMKVWKNNNNVPYSYLAIAWYAYF
jgi:subtilisin family serine protease